MKRALFLSIALLMVSCAYGYYSLRVGDPRDFWYTSQGTIEEATLTVKPKGLYMEYGLYLTFSSRGSYWTSANDSVEVTLNFKLPENAIICDSWLWIGDDIAKAELMDRWTASTIYENIVRRRRDPSILTKNYNNNYELRIFPMEGNKTRKVKITYLVPTQWNKKTITADLPTQIINTSLNKPSNFNISVFADSSWLNPFIPRYDDLTFTPSTDTVLGDYKTVSIPSSKYDQNLKIGFQNDSLFKNGIYCSKYSTGSDGIYQLAFFPSYFLDSVPSRKVAVLVDYDASNTNLSKSELLSMIENTLINNLSPSDSFNLIFSGLAISKYSDDWMSAGASDIEAVFNTIRNPLSDYSNLASLLAEGVEFVKSNGNDGKIILISNSDQYDSYDVTNTLINDVISLMDSTIQIHISDYQSMNYNYTYVNGRHINGNDYLYSNLSKLTGGSYQRVKNGNTELQTINMSFYYSSGSINSFDLYTRLNSGFCYSRYTIKNNKNIVYVDEPIYQVGKYLGTFPLEVEFSGKYNNKVFSKTIVIDPDDIVENDSTLEEIWTGQYIEELESEKQTNDVINEIVYQSLHERVLSKYTAFLCLEDTSQICENCEDESSTYETTYAINTKEEMACKDTLLVYPNPFKDKISIEIQSDRKDQYRELSIVDIKGSLIYTFELQEGLEESKHIYTWNGKRADGQSLKPGVYLLIYKTSQQKKVIKLVKQ